MKGYVTIEPDDDGSFIYCKLEDLDNGRVYDDFSIDLKDFNSFNDETKRNTYTDYDFVNKIYNTATFGYMRERFHREQRNGRVGIYNLHDFEVLTNIFKKGSTPKLVFNYDKENGRFQYKLEWSTCGAVVPKGMLSDDPHSFLTVECNHSSGVREFKCNSLDQALVMLVLDVQDVVYDITESIQSNCNCAATNLIKTMNEYMPGVTERISEDERAEEEENSETVAEKLKKVFGGDVKIVKLGDIAEGLGLTAEVGGKKQETKGASKETQSRILNEDDLDSFMKMLIDILDNSDDSDD